MEPVARRVLWQEVSRGLLEYYFLERVAGPVEQRRGLRRHDGDRTREVYRPLAPEYFLVKGRERPDLAARRPSLGPDVFR